MLKHMYIVISLVSIVSTMHGMEKRSAGIFLNNTLDQVVGKEISGTITTVEKDLEIIAHEAKDELLLLGVTQKGAYEAAVVCGALYLGSEGVKYFYNRYFAPHEQPINPAILTTQKSVNTSQKTVHLLGQFVSAQQINAIVEAKWQELMRAGNLADKTYVDTATAQTRNMATSALETTASRVASLESQVKGLGVVIHGDAKTTPGIVSAHDILKNRITALENQKQSASSSSTTSSVQHQKHEKGGGLFSGMFKKRKTGDDSAIHDDNHNGGHDADDENDTTDLHALNSNNNNNNNNNHGSETL